MFRLSNPDRVRPFFKNKNSPFFCQDYINASGQPYRTIRAYNGTGGTLTAGQPYLLKFDGDEETNPRVATVASGDVYGKHLVVFAVNATADAVFDEFVFEGHFLCMVNGTGIAKDDFLKLTVADTSTLLEDDTVRSDLSVGIACEAGASGDNRKMVWLFGDPVNIQPNNVYVTSASGLGYYPGQTRIQFDVSGNAREEVLLYTGDAAAMVAGGPYLLTFDGDEEKNPKAVLVAASGTAIINRVVFATDNSTSGNFAWFVTKGYYNVMVNGAGIAKDDFLKLTAGDDSALVEVGTSLTSAGVAIATEAGTGSDARKLCYVIGERVDIPQT